MQSIKRLAITFLSVLFASALLLPAAASASTIKQNRLLPLAPGDVPVDATTFSDPDFLWWAKQQSWASDGVLTAAEAAAVTSIGLSSVGVRDLTGIELFPDLEFLSCSDNYITQIDTSRNPKLIGLTASGNPDLVAVNVSGNQQLRWLTAAGGQLTAINLTNNPTLRTLGVARNKLTSLDLVNNTQLLNLSCENNELVQLDLSKAPELASLSCMGNHLTTLDLSNNSELQGLFVLLCINQASTANVFSPDNGATRYVDMAKVVGATNLSRVTSVTGGVLDLVSGLVLLDSATVDTIVYTYNMQSLAATDDMDVTLTLNTVAAEMIDVSYDLAEGSTPNKTTLAWGSRLTKPTDPTREGYKFLGWHTEDAQGDYVLWDFSTPVTAPVTLVARWQKLTDNPAEEKPVVKDQQPVSQQPSAQKAAATPPAIPATGNTDIVLAIVATGLALLALALLATSWRLRARWR